MIHILTGNNWFGVKRRLDELRDDFVEKNGELAVENIDGEEATFDQIKSALESLPFLSDRKMIIINRLAKNKAAAERVNELIEAANGQALIVFFEPEVDKRSIYFKSIKKLEGFEEHKEFDEQELARWLVKQASQKGGRLAQVDAVYLIERTGGNQQKLAGELEKQLAYEPAITRQTIDLLSELAPQSSIFSLLDAAFRGDLANSLRLYQDQRAQGVEPLNILGMMVWQLHAVAVVQASAGNNLSEISQQSGLKPFVLQKSQQIADRLDRLELQRLMENLLDLDIKFKTTSIDQDNALKNLLTQLA